MIESIKHKVRQERHRLTIHTFERCTERGISPDEIKEVILSGEIIEAYPEDKYGPSCLICGITQRRRILHVQCSIDPVWIITTYAPTLNPDEWEDNFKRRRKQR